MTPEEAATFMRERAILIIEQAQKLGLHGKDTYTPLELVAWNLTIMELYAEFMWNMADLIEELSHKTEFKVYKLADETKKDELSYDLDKPPFSTDFFESRDF